MAPDAIKWLEKLKGRGINLGLERMEKVMAAFPLNYKVIHVGGTNGKGSVCQFIGRILQEEGYRVGIYLSPHIERINERITINSKEISDEEMSEIAGMLMKRDEGLTFFEAMTAIALIYFRGKVDFAVLEVGMGGGYDATNIVNASITAITNVSMEHGHYLGKNIGAIASEKAGIIKGDAVITACRGIALDVIKKKAEECNVLLYAIGRDVKWERISPRKFLIKSNRQYEIETHLDGMFQGENIAIAVKIAELLGIGKKSIVKGIKKARLPGRMERIGQFLLDGAHNPEAMKSLNESIKDFDYNRLFIVFGVMKDKDVRSIIKFLPEGLIIATSIGGERAADANKLAIMLEKDGRKCIKTKNVRHAIKKAKEMADENDMICITGSLYLVGKVREILMTALNFL
ncbi:MAG: folylpolyglutamate synthase/dihydrofolate synthase family protein [Candidatus Thermoplasmatota archaeon]|nr:folylpolyglutamate synthase/dihydrofolate synthase family protein [Candidatus Thermoplasmatota archaeon]